MTIDVYTSSGTKKGTTTLPKALFESTINEGLIHQAVVMQQSNRRNTVANAKGRGEMQGSTKKLFQQKGTGRARRGPVRSPLLRGGGKAFGPKKNANFFKDMPKKMRRNALFSCLSLQAKHGAIIGLENYPEKEVKTKKMQELLGKLPVEIGRKVLFVMPEKNAGLTYSTRNIPGVKAILVNYLNPEDVLGAHKIVFLVDALKKAEEIFGGIKEKKGTTETTEKKESLKSQSSLKSPSSPSKKKTTTSTKSK